MSYSQSIGNLNYHTSGSRHVCINCGHGSLVRSNFKFTSDGKAYCIKKCSEVYPVNLGARQKGEKVE